MKIETILEKAGINWKEIDADDNYQIFKISDRLNLLYLHCKNDQFQLSRDLFDYLDGNKLPYSILLSNTVKRKLYYLQLPKDYNWVKSCFMTCDKEKIFLGKQVMNAPITEAELCKRLLKI